MDTLNDKKTIKWNAEEFKYSEKSVDWFWAVGIVSIGLAIFAIFLGNLLFAILIIIGAFTLSLQAIRKPKNVNFEINEEGIIVDKKLYQYNTLESFWIIEKEEKLMIKSKKTVVPLLVLLYKNTSPKFLREYLTKYLKEEEIAEPLGQVLMEKLGF